MAAASIRRISATVKVQRTASALATELHAHFQQQQLLKLQRRRHQRSFRHKHLPFRQHFSDGGSDAVNTTQCVRSGSISATEGSNAVTATQCVCEGSDNNNHHAHDATARDDPCGQGATTQPDDLHDHDGSDKDNHHAHDAAARERSPRSRHYDQAGRGSERRQVRRRRRREQTVAAAMTWAAARPVGTTARTP